MRYVLSFVFGVIVGAVAALLVAPSSGDDLRKEIKTQADVEIAKLQDEWQKGMQEVHDRLDKVSSEIQAASHRSVETDTKA
jgi:gas vesicle protein